MRYLLVLRDKRSISCINIMLTKMNKVMVITRFIGQIATVYLIKKIGCVWGCIQNVLVQCVKRKNIILNRMVAIIAQMNAIRPNY